MVTGLSYDLPHKGSRLDLEKCLHEGKGGGGQSLEVHNSKIINSNKSSVNEFRPFKRTVIRSTSAKF